MRRYLLLVVLMVAVFLVWRDFNPSDSHFLSTFKNISGLELSKETMIVAKDYNTHSLTEFGLCFIAKVSESDINTLISNSRIVGENIERSCGESEEYSFDRHGINITDYPFAAWYLSESGVLWAYYERY